MDKSEAILAVTRMIGLAAAELVGDEEIGRALDGSVMPDPAGRMPQDTAWDPTWCLYWAAALLAEWIGVRETMQARIAEFTSEGATFKRVLPDYAAAAAAFRAQSPIMRHIRAGGSSITLTPASGGYDPRSGAWPGVTTNAH